MTALYDALGIAPDATAAEIAAAHRKAAKKHHPDAGGDRDAFERVTRAALVLRDPARRAKYDATGDESAEPDNKGSMIAAMMNAALEKALAAARGNFEHVDLVEIMRKDTLDDIAAIKGEIAKGKEAAARYAKMLKRVQFKGDGRNLLENIVRDRRNHIEQQVGNLTNSLDGFEQLLAALEFYGWQVDEAEQVDLEDFLAGGATATIRVDPGARYRRTGASCFDEQPI